MSKYQTYSANPNLNETRAYQYDNQGRMTGIQRKTQFQNEKYTTNFKFTYEQNRILLFQNDAPVKELGLDNNNKIISDKWLTVNMGYHTVFSYSNGNLMHFGPNTEVAPDLSPLTSTYTYTNYKNDFSYQKYLFGKEWKKNICLDHFTETNSITSLLENTSEKAVSEYRLKYGTHWYNYKNYYYFKDNGQIVKKMTETTPSFAPGTRTEWTYEYK